MPKVQMAAYMKVFVGSMGVATLFIAMAQAFVAPEDDSPYVTVEPRQVALEVGRAGHFDCTGLQNYTKKIQWTRADGSPVPVRGSSNITPYGANNYNMTLNTNGTGSTIDCNDAGRLFIVGATLNDTQDFVCRTLDGQHAVSVSLKVFIMPSYYQESVIIISINGCLLVIFTACMITAKVHEVKAKRKNERLLRGRTYP